MIYFLQDSERFGIKIGYAKNDAEARAATLQTGNQIPLVILATTPGERKDEHVKSILIADADATVRAELKKQLTSRSLSVIEASWHLLPDVP